MTYDTHSVCLPEMLEMKCFRFCVTGEFFVEYGLSILNPKPELPEV